VIDTHCHLTDPRLGDQLPAVLARASQAGVHRMITISTSIDDAAACIEVCRNLPQVRCTVGVHPNYVAEESAERLPQLRGLQANPCVVAIGEIGLDYHYGLEHKDRQADFFRQQLQIATEFNRPVVIHCRQAADDTLAILAEFPSVRCVFHCFTGTRDEATRILDRGFFLGFTGPITFKKSDELREVVQLTPMDRLFVETDAPYLSPEPHRKQKINEPALVMHVAEMVATVKQMTLREIDQRTTENARRFFAWE
jgi:TatD DNase family protein